MNNSHTPAGQHTLTPGLTVNDAASAIAFYARALGAVERYRLTVPDGRIAHAELAIGDSIFMVQDENPEWNTLSPTTLGGVPLRLRVDVDDADAVMAASCASGARETMPVERQFWGDRMGGIRDPFGYDWLIATRVDDVPIDRYQQLMDAFMAEQGPNPGQE